MKGKVVAMALGEWIISLTKGDGWDGLAVFILELQPQMVTFLSNALTRKTPLMLEGKEGLGIFLAAGVRAGAGPVRVLLWRPLR